MATIWARRALLGSRWADAVEVEGARVASLIEGAAPAGQGADLLMPAPVNVQNHALQRAMAGLTERRSPAGRDSFWTWRELMFRFLDALTPDQVEARFGASVEFHYLHHQPGGHPYRPR